MISVALSGLAISTAIWTVSDKLPWDTVIRASPLPTCCYQTFFVGRRDACVAVGLCDGNAFHRLFVPVQYSRGQLHSLDDRHECPPTAVRWRLCRPSA